MKNSDTDITAQRKNLLIVSRVRYFVPMLFPRRKCALLYLGRNEEHLLCFCVLTWIERLSCFPAFRDGVYSVHERRQEGLECINSITFLSATWLFEYCFLVDAIKHELERPWFIPTNSLQSSRMRFSPLIHPEIIQKGNKDGEERRGCELTFIEEKWLALLSTGNVGSAVLSWRKYATKSLIVGSAYVILML